MFLVLAALHVHSVWMAAAFVVTTPWLFMAHAFIQAGVEAFALAWVAGFLHKKGAKVLEILFISCTFILTIVHLVDFHLVRLMDLSIWFACESMLDESWHNFIEVLIASNVPLVMWVIGLFVVIISTAAAVYFFYCTKKMVLRKKLWKLNRRAVWSLTGILGVLGICDYASTSGMSFIDFEHYTKALPWKISFFSPPHPLQISVKPSPFSLETKWRTSKDPATYALAKKPNIFLFVIESLREELLTGDVAPRMHAFKQANLSIQESWASADATQCSQFSLFFSQLPHHWGEGKSGIVQEGSPILQILKEAGYKIHVYSASQLAYYQMDELIFGQGGHLAEDIFVELPSAERPAWQCDLIAFEKLQEDIYKYQHEEGHLFITFVESTHFDYSWPLAESYFAPIVHKINFFKAASLQENLEGIKNRYRNAVHYVDNLVGCIFDTLEGTGGMKNSVIVLTSDHGEEFLEHGHLFHASALTEEQLQVPIYYRFPKLEKKGLKVQATMTSHVDVFPSILHYLYGDERFNSVFDGQSIFAHHRWPYAVSARYNASRSPHELLFWSEEAKMRMRFNNVSDPTSATGAYILSLEDREGRPLPMTGAQVEYLFSDVLDKIR